MKIISRSDAILKGLTTFFTGKPCKNGHVSQRKVHSYACKECARISGITYRETSNSPSAVKMRERAGVARKKRPVKSKEEVMQKREEYYRINRDRILAASRDYHKNITDELKMKRRVRSASRRNADGFFNENDVLELSRMQGNRCGNPYCKCDLLVEKYHIDHIIPLSKGGTHWPDNLQILCARCNSGKRDKDYSDWLEYERYKFKKNNPATIK